MNLGEAQGAFGSSGESSGNLGLRNPLEPHSLYLGDEMNLKVGVIYPILL